MGRHNSNARPQEEVPPIILEEVAPQPEELLPAPPVLVPVAPARHHGFRDAAKHAPSRISSRMYSQVRAVTAALDVADLHLARVTLPAATLAQVTTQIVDYRARLKAARDQVPDALRNREMADAVKSELSHLDAVTKLLEPAIVALAHHAKAERVTLTGELSEAEQAQWADAAAAAQSVLDALAQGRAGVISSAVARLRTAGMVSVAA